MCKRAIGPDAGKKIADEDSGGARANGGSAAATPLWSNGAPVWRANCPDLTAGDTNWWVAAHGSHAFVSNPIFV
jgi:hypothetical protein